MLCKLPTSRSISPEYQSEMFNIHKPNWFTTITNSLNNTMRKKNNTNFWQKIESFLFFIYWSHSWICVFGLLIPFVMVLLLSFWSTIILYYWNLSRKSMYIYMYMYIRRTPCDFSHFSRLNKNCDLLLNIRFRIIMIIINLQLSTPYEETLYVIMRYYSRDVIHLWTSPKIDEETNS